MAADKHALLSASSAERWLNCPPSVRLAEGLAADKEPASPYAAEGTEAHALCEHKLSKALDRPLGRTEEPRGQYYTEEMEDAATGYAAYVLEAYDAARERCPDAALFIEHRLDFSTYVPGGFGTGDAVIIADGTLVVIDFKYGQGIGVSAKGNTQLRCYALGALNLAAGLYRIDKIKMCIYQPRRANVSEAEMTRQELEDWGASTLAPAARDAYRGSGKFKCGDWCRFCRAKAVCRARHDYNMELAALDFREPPLLNDAEIAEVLDKAEDFEAWLKNVQDYALQAAKSGKEWPGFKLVEGVSRRGYVDEAQAAEAVLQAGFDPYEKKLLGITAMTSRLGRTRFNEILGPLVKKPKGKLTLVSERDARPKVDIKTFFEEEN